jgi:hypothetical protein
LGGRFSVGRGSLDTIREPFRGDGVSTETQQSTVVRSVWPLLAAVASTCALAASPQPGAVHQLDPEATFTATYGIAPSAEFDPSADATTSVGGFAFDLNAALGADRYYDHSTPITGQNTISSNLEAGYFWNGHETLQHVATNATNFIADAQSWGGASVAAKYDRHATWAAMLLGGRATESSSAVYQEGIAPGTDLRAAAIASQWNAPAYALSFGLTLDSFLTPYEQTFGVADVVNSSYGFTDPDGTDFRSIAMDAYCFQNPATTYVASAGNSGPSANTVGSPGSDYNAITVGALDGPNTYTVMADFSSRAPQDFGYINSEGQTVTVAGVRAAVDVSAPGNGLVSAFYGGQNGGNNADIGGVDQGSGADLYSIGIRGTSFAAPIVAGGAALVASAAKTLPTLSGNANASQSVVVKALLLNGADKTSGWDNGQTVVAGAGSNYVQTTQGLDYAAGTGRMNLDATFDLQVNGQTDVPGTAQGDLGDVVKTGWDYGNAEVGVSNDYVISEWLRGGTTFTTTLTWLRNRLFDYASLGVADVAQADLNLSIWELDGSDSFTTLVARSESLYNTTEHLSFTLPRSGFYGLRVEYPFNTFDNTIGAVWGDAANLQPYAVSWQAVPEPATLALAGIGVAGVTLARRRRR